MTAGSSVFVSAWRGANSVSFMPVEWPKQNSHYVSSAKGLGRPRRQETRNVDNKTEMKTGNASTESGLPFLTMTINEMANTQFSHRTQELRLQMMQQTGSLVGLHNSVNSTRKFDMGGTLDAMLDTINSRVEENPYSYDKNIKGPPWYLPTLNLHQLTQCCCRPNSRPLFGPLDGDRLSTICHCSGASHQNSKKAATSTLTRKRRPSSPRNRSDDVGNCEKVDKVYLLRGRKRFRELTYLQRLLLEQWCRTISDVSCRERLELDPTKLHDKVMKEVRRDEHTVQLFEQVQKHERMQEREYTRQIQRLEDERMYGANDARYGFAMQSDWRSLLTSWDKGTARAGESAYSASQGSQDGSTPSKIVNSLRAPTRNTFVTVGEGTHTGVCPRRAQGFLAGPYHVPGLLGRPMHRSNVGYQLRNSGADEENIPLQELQKLLVAVKDGSLMNAVSASRKGARSHRLDAGLLYERAGRNTIFALPITFYMDSNWLECIIFDNDLPAVKLITQKLQEHISSKSSQGAKNMSPFSLAKCSYGGFKAPRHLQVLSESNDPQSLLKAFMEGNQRPHDLEGASLFLLPLRLCVADTGLPPRVVMTDAASVVSVRKKGSIATIPSSVFTNHKGHGYDTSGKRAAAAKEGIVPPLNLCKYLAAADVSGRALCASEHLTNYSVELQIVIKQSAWRSTTLKQLANEEYDHLKRKILAKVFVMLAMSNAMIEHERRRESVSYVTAQTLSGDATVDATPTLLSMPRTKRVAVHSLALPPVTSYPGSVEDSNLEFSLSDFVLPLTCAYEYTTQVDVYAAPAHRDHYVVDAKHLFCVAATALEETNNSILPALARLATEYRCQYSRLARMAEEDVCKATVSCSSGFSLDDSKRASAHLSGALELLKLESDYSKLLVTLLRNESTIIYYNLHHLPHYRFIQQRKLLWGHLYLRTLRLAYAFCVLVQELGLFPIPPKYRPFLRPVLLLLEYHGGQEELRSRAEETLLELEMRANELGAMLCRKEVTTHYMPELDAAATVVAEGEYSVSRFISCLASPDDVLSPVLLPVDLPQQLFSDVPSIAG